MGLFRNIKNQFRKSEAAIIVQNLLEMHTKIGLLDGDVAVIANKIVEAVWQDSSHLLDGRFGRRPHKLALATAALHFAIEVRPENDPVRQASVISLGNIINEISTNGALYPFSELDWRLFEAATACLAEALAPYSDLAEASGSDGVPFDEDEWEKWYTRYKEGAAEINAGLAPNEDGVSLLDLMEDEPLKRAFRDGVEPRQLGRQFAEQFDPLKMGVR